MYSFIHLIVAMYI